MARKPICPTPPLLGRRAGRGVWAGLPYLPCWGGRGVTPSYMAQNDPHVALIILTTHMWVENSIAFGSAPRREVDSQPISPLARLAVSQTETHNSGFLSVADASPSSGETFYLRPSSG